MQCCNKQTVTIQTKANLKLMMLGGVCKNDSQVAWPPPSHKNQGEIFIAIDTCPTWIS